VILHFSDVYFVDVTGMMLLKEINFFGRSYLARVNHKEWKRDNCSR